MFKIMKKLKVIKSRLKELNNEGSLDIQAAAVRAYESMMVAQQQMHYHPRIIHNLSNLSCFLCRKIEQNIWHILHSYH